MLGYSGTPFSGYGPPQKTPELILAKGPVPTPSSHYSSSWEIRRVNAVPVFLDTV